MLAPKKVKHRKWQKKAGTSGRVASRNRELSFGSLGLRALTEGWVTSRQIEAARRVIVRYVRKGGRLWIRVFPDKPMTKKGSEVPMGGGKGSPEYYVVVVKPGTIMFEIDGIEEEAGREALRLAGYKLPVKTKVVTREG